jgi:hypothetical protein
MSNDQSKATQAPEAEAPEARFKGDTKALSAILGSTSDKRTRRFLRTLVKTAGGSVGTDTPGSGGRYAFDMSADEIAVLKARFALWEAKGAGSRNVGASALGISQADIEAAQAEAKAEAATKAAEARKRA